MKNFFVVALLCCCFSLTYAFSFSFSEEKKYENTICFTYVIGDHTSLEGEKCMKKSIKEMNQEGWRVVQIVTGTTKIGVLFERVVK